MKFKIVRFAVFLSIAAAFSSCAGARAQEEPAKHVVFTEGAGYIAGVPAAISGADSEIHPDPQGRYALIARNEVAPRQQAFAPASTNEGASDASSEELLLYDSHTGRVKIMWRADSMGKSSTIGDVTWLKGTDAALCVVSESTMATPAGSGDTKITSSLLLIRPGSTGLISRPVLQDSGYISVNASPTLPIATFSVAQSVKDKEGQTRFVRRHFTVDDHGTIGSQIPLSPQANSFYLWNADGTTTYYRDTIVDPPTEATPGAPAAATPPRRQWDSFNVQTAVLTPMAAPPPFVARPKIEDTNSLRLVSGALSAAPPGIGEKQPTAKPAKFAPLWLIRADQKHEGRLPTAIVIAPDAQQSCLLADDSAVLYVADRSVFAVPLIRQPRPDIDLAYRLLLRQQTLSQAKQIGLALIMYNQDNQERFPDAANLTAALAPYLKNDDLMNNPETGAPGFTFALPGQSQSDITDAAHTVLGYMAGPGGRVVLMADGHTHWEDKP